MKSVFLIAIVAVAMIGVMVPSISAEETPSWTKEKLLEQKIPTWMNSIGVLLVEDKITDDEFYNVLNFLIENEIISPEQTSFKIFVTGIELYSNYNIIKNSELNILSNSDSIDIFNYETRQECLEGILKNNQKTILNIKKCGKIIEDHTKTPKISDFIDRVQDSREHKNANLGWTESPQTKNVYKSGSYYSQYSSMDHRGQNTGIYDNYGYDNYGYDNYGYDFNMDAEVQYALNRADHYAYQSLDAVDTYANQWVNGQISYGEYERKAMASMEYYGNQYAYEMEGYWDSKYP